MKTFIGLIEIDWDSLLNIIFEMGVARWSLAFQGCHIIWIFYADDVAELCMVANIVNSNNPSSFYIM